MKHSIKVQRLIDWGTFPIEKHMEDYSLFLNDGEFERYQPFIYKHTKYEARDAQRELVRRLWISGRMFTQGTIRRSYYEGLFNVEFQKLRAMEE